MKNKKSRVLYMIIAGIIVSLLLSAIVPFPMHAHNRLLDHLSSIIITMIVWEGNLWIDTWMNIKFPWVEKPGKRIVIHGLTSLTYSAVAIFGPMMAFNSYICQLNPTNKMELMVSSILVGIMVTFIILSIEISTQFFLQWKNSLIEVEKYKTESVQAQLQNLKSQINPHFLFNNMSVLSSLVYKDQDKAVDFINQLSKVYRYLLDNKNSELVSLETELEFIKSYTYLLQIRFDTTIHFEFAVSANHLKLMVPPMALQMLIENAIKHNEISAELPLTVSITANDQMLVVSNNLQLRTVSEPGSNTGLQNIKERYKFYTNKEVEVIQSASSFVVKIPLIVA